MTGKVKVGPATVAGYGATLVGLVASVLVVVFGVDQEQAALVASAVWSVVAFSWTQWGRYAQARDAAKRAPSNFPTFSKIEVEAGSMTPSLAASPRPHAAVTYEKGQIHTDEPGDPDALPDYATEENPPPDDGDTLAGQEMRS